MTKADIISEIVAVTGVEKSAAEKSVEAFFIAVKGHLVAGRNVYFRGFGSFIVKKRAKKIARNITKNTTMIVPEHFIPAFKPAPVFVDKVKTAHSTKKKKKK